MASLSNDPKGLRRIQFVGLDGRRKTIRLGRVPKRDANGVREKIEKLLASKLSATAWEPELAKWVAEIPPRLADKLAAFDLIPKRHEPEKAPEGARLAAFLDNYIKSRPRVKPSTKTIYGHTRRCLVRFFGADKRLEEITPGDAADWRIWLETPKTEIFKGVEGQGLAENTTRRRCGIARQFLNDALFRDLIKRNPFARMEKGVAWRKGSA